MTAALSDTPNAMSRRRALSSLAVLSALGASWFTAPRAKAEPVQTRSSAEHAALIETLIGQMTIDEKAGQLNLLADPFRFRPYNVNPLDAFGDPARTTDLIRRGLCGALFNGVGAEAGRRIQRIAVEEARLKIPMLFAADIIHGMTTVFPVPLAEASAFDEDLAYRTARVAALEGAVSGIHQA